MPPALSLGAIRPTAPVPQEARFTPTAFLGTGIHPSGPQLDAAEQGIVLDDKMLGSINEQQKSSVLMPKKQ